jgi:soluble lytic murein transglycosylase-like protein
MVIPALVAVGLLLVLAATSVQTPSVSAKYGQGATAQPDVLAAFFSPSVQFWGAAIERWAASQGLDPNLVATIMQIESCGDPEAVSSAGARGLFQVMPFHFKTNEDPLDPDTNARRGLAYFKGSLNLAGGDIRQALAGYNGGTGLVGTAETQWPAETSAYADWGEGIYRQAQAKSSQSDVLAQWLSHGGARLCRQAGQRLGIKT